MRCDGTNGYLGWRAVNEATGEQIKETLWVDPTAKTYGVFVDGAEMVLPATSIREDADNKVMWITP